MKFLLFSLAICLCAVEYPASARSIDSPDPGKFFALPLPSSQRETVERYGVPFLPGELKPSTNGPSTVKVQGSVDRIFLLGMTDTLFIGCWADPANQPVRLFIGDNVGEIRLAYADGSTQTFPLIVGENIWWGTPFYRSPGPFPTDANFRAALASALRLYPPMPVQSGQYLAVITPTAVPLQSITISSSPAKHGSPLISAITVETGSTNDINGATAVSPGAFSPELEKFIQTKALRPAGTEESKTQRRLDRLSSSLYSSDEVFLKSRIVPETPAGYSGPEISFAGNVYARALANIFSFNVQDMLAKFDDTGMYHTSTKGALLWGYNGGQFGTYATNAELCYSTSWSRDMGRTIQELTVLGYTNEAARCADYCLRTARLWEDSGAPTYADGQLYPPHWSRVANAPKNAPPFENDGHGLVTMFLYRYWQRLPDRDAWLRARWPDVKAAGDWILWQFDHPEISGATNGVLHTTGESAGGNGYSVYADYVCMDALTALAQMADSIGETNSAGAWRERAEKMRIAMAAQYMIDDPKYGRVWTLAHAGWPTHPTVLGPLIFLADYHGFAPQDDDPVWRPVNAAAYQRLIDSYQPYGFYGQAMGYGQGFVTESALLLDRMQDATAMLDWVAKQVYDPRFGSFVVPEGVQIEPGGKYWYRAGDLGNGVQEAEIIKALRLVIGVDDTRPDRLQFYPRMPYGWKQMAVNKYPVLFESAGNPTTTFLRYKLKRSGQGMKLEINADEPLGQVAMRLGPFAKPPHVSDIWVNGQNPAGAVAAQSGDSWWVTFTLPVGPERTRPE